MTLLASGAGFVPENNISRKSGADSDASCSSHHAARPHGRSETQDRTAHDRRDGGRSRRPPRSRRGGVSGSVEGKLRFRWRADGGQEITGRAGTLARHSSKPTAADRSVRPTPTPAARTGAL